VVQGANFHAVGSAQDADETHGERLRVMAQQRKCTAYGAAGQQIAEIA
jgi:hypothetical protein